MPLSVAIVLDIFSFYSDLIINEREYERKYFAYLFVSSLSLVLSIYLSSFLSGLDHTRLWSVIPFLLFLLPIGS